LRLRTVGCAEFDWRDLLAFVRQSGPDSALVRSVHPDEYRWGLAEYLLAELVDVGRLLYWSKTKDGARNRNRPEQFPRPGIRSDVKRVKGTPVPMDKIRARMAALRRG
jgi:hypothetical protein